jgi:hypothetical protein
MLTVTLALGLAIAGSFLAVGFGQAMQTPEAGSEAGIRVVQGIAGAGPLDIYVDGSIALIGLVFPETSAEIVLRGGDHQFAVVPTGGGADEAIAAGQIALNPGTHAFAALLGVPDDASVGLFTADLRPVEAGRARFRVINGSPDSGEIVPAFTGGEAISEALGFGDAAEYAAIDAGTYDLDILDAASGASLLSLPQTPLAEGVVTDIILVGQLSDGTLQALIESTAVPVARAVGRSAQIVAGTCAQPGDAQSDLGLVRQGQGDAVGVADAQPTAQGYGLAGIPFTTLIADPHAVVIAEGDGAATIAACGDIGGRLTDTGALVIALRTAGTDRPAGVAVISPGLDDPDTTGVSVFLTVAPAVETTVATPAAVSG